MEQKNILIDEFRKQTISNKIPTNYDLKRQIGNLNKKASILQKREQIEKIYISASNIFNADYEQSIAVTTAKYYGETIANSLNVLTSKMDSLCAASTLLFAYIELQVFIEENSEELIDIFTHELIYNQKYYKLFNLEYFKDLAITNGITAAVSEMENDLNIRANTFYGTAFKEYTAILPRYDEKITMILKNI